MCRRVKKDLDQGLQDIFTIWLFFYCISGAETWSGCPSSWGRALPLACVSEWSAVLSFIQGVHKVTHHLLEVLEGLGLDLMYLCLKELLPWEFFYALLPSLMPTDLVMIFQLVPPAHILDGIGWLALEASEMSFKHDLWHNISNPQSVQAASDAG